MSINLTEQTFRSTYKDDYRDSDNYSRILFNAGRALQARELTQMQTIIQAEISRFANNIFQKDGVPVLAGGVSINNKYAFIKIEADQNNSFSNVSSMREVKLVGETSGITVIVKQAIAAVDGDPNTIYVYYDSDPTTQSASLSLDSPRQVIPGEVLTNSSLGISLTVQTENTTTNPSYGYGSTISVGTSHFYVQGRFVFVPEQTIFLSKYKTYQTADLGFKVLQDIVTSSDTDALYDNQGVVPNRSSPGADRWRLRLQFAKRNTIVTGDTFVYFCRVEGGVIVHQLSSSEGYNEVKNFVSRRIKEIHGDFIKKYWKVRVEPNGTNSSNTLMLRIDPGIGYVDGKRVATTFTQSVPIPKATDTVVREEEQIGIDYGNFYYFDSGVGMLDVDTCESVTMYAGYDGADSAIGTANIRAITEGTNSIRTNGYTYLRPPLYKAYLFNIFRNNFNYSVRDVKSIKSNTNSHLINLVPTTNNQGTILHEPKNNGLLFDTPLRRPKSFTDVTMTFMKKYNFTASGTTHTITLTDIGESFVNENDIIVASSTVFAPSGVAASIQSGNKDIVFSGLTGSVSYEAIVFVRKTNAGVKTKTLTETTITSPIVNDGKGLRYVNLGKSDIYSINRITLNDSDGEDAFTSFNFDAGGKMTHFDDGRLIYSGGGIDSGQNIFVRYKYFTHSTSGQFFAVNSYDGQLEYLDIPAQKLPGGGSVSLRDALDFRPITNGNGTFTVVPSLPVPTDTITTDAEYYLPRSDRLIISRDGELRYIVGSSSLNPKYPDVPSDCIDLYKFSLNPNTMHSQDLRTTLIPRKGYTMADINKIEEKLDKLEEMTTLSLLELNTKFLKVLDSDGNERTKSGFFVDSFKNHSHSQTKSPEYRAAIDKRNKLLRPTFMEDCVDLHFDSAAASQTNVVLRDDYVLLNYYEAPYEAQDLASSTENLAPFFVPITVGTVLISPETDSWKETEKVGETVVGRSTEFDLKNSLNWNNSENEWFGIDPSDLEVGDAATSFVSGTSTSVTHNSLDPILIGTETTEKLGEWVKVGNVTDVETLYTETVEISREREEEISRSTIDGKWDYFLGYVESPYYNYDYYTGAAGSSYYDWYNLGWSQVAWGLEQLTVDTWDVVTSETRGKVRATNTSTYETTKTINTENTYEGTAEIVTTSTTSNTVNRISSESTIRETVGNKIIDISVIPYMRSIKIYFKADGLRPNTQYFSFFDGTNVSPFCREESLFLNFSAQKAAQSIGNADDEGTQRTTQEHSQGKGNLITDAEGSLVGSFEVPNNVSMRFLTGEREFSLLDVNAHNFSAALSFAKALFYSRGVLEKYEDEVQVTRVLKVVGNISEDTDRSVDTKKTVWTESLISSEVAVDVRSTNTLTTLVTDTTTTREHVGSDVTYGWQDWSGITAVNHTTDTVTPAGGTVDLEITNSSDAEANGVKGKHYYTEGANPNIYNDPLAQTFLITQSTGVFVTSVEVYFSSKSDTAPVFCELRPTVNGVPSSAKMLVSKKLSPSQVTIVPAGSNQKQMLQHPTKFTFDYPVFLESGEYALVLRPGNNNPNYNIFVANVGELQLGSNDTYISQQPTLGAFFRSQNGKLWEPSSNQDMTYRINVAQFSLSGKAVLENVNIPPVSLARDPLIVDSGSNIVRVQLRGHGLRDGDQTWIRGIDSATSFGNGLTGADINGVRTVIGYDNSGYTYQASSAATSRKWFGGSSVTSQRNINFEVLRPEINVTQPGTTNITFSAKTTSQQSLAGDETRFVKDNTFNIIENQKNNEFSTARAIYNRRTESLTGAGKLAGDRSATIQVAMSTTNPFVSPVIDLQRAKLNCIHNLISRQDSAATDGFNVPLTYVPELHPFYGTESAKHVTKETVLTEEAVGLKILIAANRPPQSDFLVYYRTASQGDTVTNRLWTLVNPESTLPPDTNKNVFREYRYLVGGEGGTLEPFTIFQVKIVMRSTSSAKIPSFRDLRVLALAV